jgi:hypothetical protein
MVGWTLELSRLRRHLRVSHCPNKGSVTHARLAKRSALWSIEVTGKSAMSVLPYTRGYIAG